MSDVFARWDDDVLRNLTASPHPDDRDGARHELKRRARIRAFADDQRRRRRVRAFAAKTRVERAMAR